MPTSAGDGKDVGICTDITQDLERRVMLKEKIHFYAYAADVLEHVGELHIFRIRAEAVEAVMSISQLKYKADIEYSHIVIVDLQNVWYLRKCFSQIRLIEVTSIVMKIRVSDVLFMLGGPLSVLSVLLSAHCEPLL